MKQYIEIKFTDDNFTSEDDDNDDDLQTPRPSVDRNNLHLAALNCNEDYPNLSDPFPNVSQKTQFHIAAKNRMKILEYQHGFEQRLLQRWLTEQTKKLEQITSFFLEDKEMFDHFQKNEDLQDPNN